MKQKFLSTLYLLLMMSAALFTGCSQNEEIPSAIIPADDEVLTQTVFADETSGKSGVTFTAAGAWTSSIATQTTPVNAMALQTLMATTSTESTSAWVSIDPSSGDHAGAYTITITLETNTTGADRTAVITVSCNGTNITITVTQKATDENGNVPSGQYGGTGNFIYSLVPQSLVVDGAKQFMGQAGGGKAVEVQFYKNGIVQGGIYFQIPIPSSENRLPAGNYTFSSSRAIGTFYYLPAVFGGRTCTPIDGTLEIIRQGDTYTISASIACADADGSTGTVTGSYTGYIPVANANPNPAVNIVGTWLNVTDPNEDKYVFVSETEFQWYSDSNQSAPNKRGNYTITFSSTAATLTLSVLNLGTTETYQFSVNDDKTTIYLNNVAYNKQTGTNPNPDINIVGMWLNVTAGNYNKYAFLTVSQFEYYINDTRIKQGTYEINSTGLILKIINSDGTITTEAHQFSIDATGSIIYIDNMAYNKQPDNPNPVNIVGTWLNVTDPNEDKYVFVSETEFQWYSDSNQSAPNKRGNYTITFSSTAATLTLSVLNLGTTETYQFSVNADKTTIYLNNVAYNKKTGTNPNPSVPEVFHAKPYLANIAMNASSGAITDIDALLIQSVTWGSLWYNIGGYINSLDDLLTDLKNRIETATGKEIAAIYASNVPNSNNNYPPVVENTPLGSIDADGTVNPTDPVVYILWDE